MAFGLKGRKYTGRTKISYYTDYKDYTGRKWIKWEEGTDREKYEDACAGS